MKIVVFSFKSHSYLFPSFQLTIIIIKYTRDGLNVIRNILCTTVVNGRIRFWNSAIIEVFMFAF